MEVEEQGSINFLDLTIRRIDTALSFKIFRKPTHTDALIPASSFHPPSHKAAAFHAMAHRIFNVPMDFEDFKKEEDTIYQIGKNNGYDEDYIRRILRKHRMKDTLRMIYVGRPSNKECAGYVRIPYIGQVSLKVGRFIENTTGKKVSYSSSTNLGRSLINCKDEVMKNRKSGVYRVNCNDCNVCYIGQTGRNFKDRLNEHRRAIGKEDSRSVFANHLYSTGHSCNFHNFKILHKCNKGKTVRSFRKY